MSLESYPLAPLHKQDNEDKIHSYHLPLYHWHTITTVSDNGTEAIKEMVLFICSFLSKPNKYYHHFEII